MDTPSYPSGICTAHTTRLRSMHRTAPAVFAAAIILAPLIFPAPARAQSGGLSGVLRSVTGALGGPKSDTPQQQNVTSTLGTRGMEEGGQKAAGPASEDYRLMEGWAATASEAERTAKTRGLASRQVKLKSTGSTQGAQQ